MHNRCSLIVLTVSRRLPFKHLQLKDSAIGLAPNQTNIAQIPFHLLILSFQIFSQIFLVPIQSTISSGSFRPTLIKTLFLIEFPNLFLDSLFVHVEDMKRNGDDSNYGTFSASLHVNGRLSSAVNATVEFETLCPITSGRRHLLIGRPRTRAACPGKTDQKHRRQLRSPIREVLRNRKIFYWQKQRSVRVRTEIRRTCYVMGGVRRRQNTQFKFSLFTFRLEFIKQSADNS